MKPKKYYVTWAGRTENLKFFYTDNYITAENKAILKNGQMWINTRYDAEIRLRRIYLRLWAQSRLPKEICYPHLLTNA